MAPRKSTSPAPRRRSSRPSLGTTPKKFTYSAIGETTVDADEKAAALAHEAALLKAREARVARDNAEADAAETGPLYLAMGQAAAISAAGEAFCALAIKGESLDAYRLGVFTSFSALLTAAIMPWLAVLAQAEMHPLMKTAVDSCVQIPLISASFIAYFEIVLGGGLSVRAAQFVQRGAAHSTRAIYAQFFRAPPDLIIRAGDPDEADGRLPRARRRRLRLLALRLPPQLHAGATESLKLRSGHARARLPLLLSPSRRLLPSPAAAGPAALPPARLEPRRLPVGRDLVVHGVSEVD